VIYDVHRKLGAIVRQVRDAALSLPAGPSRFIIERELEEIACALRRADDDIRKEPMRAFKQLVAA
jgi:hypothetical protein